MSNNIINISKKAGYKIPVRLSWFQATEESIIKNLALKTAVEIDIFVSDDKNIKKLNKTHRKMDKPTDVLSFCLQDKKTDAFILPPDGVLHMGEIIISFETALRDSAAQGISLEDELQFLLIHGTLHLLGYDHEKVADGRVMRKKEDEIFIAIKAKL